MQPTVAIIMGSQSDLEVMQGAAEMLKKFGVDYEMTIISAHRTPDSMRTFSSEARAKGFKVIIAGAGGAAHLPGMTASYTTLPVIGVPIKSSNSMDGWDSVLSILQMPTGVPVATVALNAARNAGILAVQILATNNELLAAKLSEYKIEMEKQVKQMAENLKDKT